MIKRAFFTVLLLGLFGFSQQTSPCLGDAAAELTQADEYSKTWDYEMARQAYEGIINCYPNTAYSMEAQKGIAISYIMEFGKEAEARRAIDKLLAEYSENSNMACAVYEIAECYRRKLGDFGKAIELYSYVVNNWGGQEYAMWSQSSLAICYLEQHRDEAADVAIERLFDEFSGYENSVEGVCRVAQRCRLQLQKYERALGLYEQVVARWPASEQAIWCQRQVVICNLYLENYSAAEAAVGKLFADYRQHPRFSRNLYFIARKYSEFGKYGQAEKYFRQIIEDWPGSEYGRKAELELPKMEIEVLSKSGDEANAQAATEKMAADYNGHPDLGQEIFLMGEKCYKEGRSAEVRGLSQEAKDCFTKAVKIWAQMMQESVAPCKYSPQAYYFCGQSYEKLGEYSQAIACYEKVLSNWPDYVYCDEVQLSIGRCYRSLRDSGSLAQEQAGILIEQACRKVIEEYPDCSSATKACEQLAWLNFKKGRWSEAVKYFELALEKQNEDGRPYHQVLLYPLGRSYEQIGQFDKARQAYEQFVSTVSRWDPRVGTVKMRLKKIAESQN